eukprot:1141027-Pelagomonas_calceolata.AAC.2
MEPTQCTPDAAYPLQTGCRPHKLTGWPCLLHLLASHDLPMTSVTLVDLKSESLTDRSLVAGGNVAAVTLSGVQAAQEDTALGMNRSQLAGVATALNHKVSLLQGPPGTGRCSAKLFGKNLLLSMPSFPAFRDLTPSSSRPFDRQNYNHRAISGHAEAQLRAQSPHSGLRPVKCECQKLSFLVLKAWVAVDNLLEGLVDAGVRAVRTGQPVKVRVYVHVYMPVCLMC